ncbi:MAG: hypothetical protein ACLR0U_26055 [Enterocloster clostridioformis]
MGLIFSLDWKPRKAENDMELDTAELEQILLRDHMLLTIEDIERVAAHFRSRIRMEKLKLEEKGDMINYMDLVRMRWIIANGLNFTCISGVEKESGGC